LSTYFAKQSQIKTSMTIHIGALGDLTPEARTILLLGSRSSDHLREILRIAEFKGRIAYRIESETELQPRWFDGLEVVGIVVGATGLQALVDRVLNRLDQFSAVQAQGMLGGRAR
jgi:4-hydroxy-3-methylbut-2-enyl diphosphate reductase